MQDHRGSAANLETSRDGDAKKSDLQQLWSSTPTLLSLVAVALLGVIATSSVVLIGAWLWGLGGSLGWFLMVFVLVPCSGLVLVWQGRLVLAARARWWVKRRLPHQQCAACEFSLAGLAPEPDGCTVCPECGAAWKLGDIADDR